MRLRRLLVLLTLVSSLADVYTNAAHRAQASTADRQFRALTGFGGSHSGVWSYGFGVAGTEFRYYDTFSYKCVERRKLTCWQSSDPGAFSAFVQKNLTGTPFVFGDTTVAVVDALMLHPGSGLQDSIVRWTSPLPGRYQISGYFEILADCPSGVLPKLFVDNREVTTDAFGGGDGRLTGPGANLRTLTHGQRKSFSFTRILSQGTIVSFGVNADGDYLCDTTGFDAIIKRVDP